MSNYLSSNRLPFKFTHSGVLAQNTTIFDWDTQEVESSGLNLHVISLGTACHMAITMPRCHYA